MSKESDDLQQKYGKISDMSSEELAKAQQQGVQLKEQGASQAQEISPTERLSPPAMPGEDGKWRMGAWDRNEQGREGAWERGHTGIAPDEQNKDQDKGEQKTDMEPEME